MFKTKVKKITIQVEFDPFAPKFASLSNDQTISSLCLVDSLGPVCVLHAKVKIYKQL